MKAITREDHASVWVRRLKEARRASGMSQRQLGVAAGLDEGVASTRVNRYEVGVHRPDYGIAIKLAQALDVPVAYLYCDDDVTAEILLTLHRVTVEVRQRVLKLLQESAT